MEYLIIILLVIAVAGFYFYRKRHVNKGDADQVGDTYECHICNESDCDCHKK